METERKSRAKIAKFYAMTCILQGMESHKMYKSIYITYSMKALRGQALQDPNEIIFSPFESNLSSSGRSDVDFPIGTRYSSMSN